MLINDLAITIFIDDANVIKDCLNKFGGQIIISSTGPSSTISYSKDSKCFVLALNRDQFSKNLDFFGAMVIEFKEPINLKVVDKVFSFVD